MFRLWKLSRQEFSDVCRLDRYSGEVHKNNSLYYYLAFLFLACRKKGNQSLAQPNLWRSPDKKIVSSMTWSNILLQVYGKQVEVMQLKPTFILIFTQNIVFLLCSRPTNHNFGRLQYNIFSFFLELSVISIFLCMIHRCLIPVYWNTVS